MHDASGITQNEHILLQVRSMIIIREYAIFRDRVSANPNATLKNHAQSYRMINRDFKCSDQFT